MKEKPMRGHGLGQPGSMWSPAVGCTLSFQGSRGRVIILEAAATASPQSIGSKTNCIYRIQMDRHDIIHLQQMLKGAVSRGNTLCVEILNES